MLLQTSLRLSGSPDWSEWIDDDLPDDSWIVLALQVRGPGCVVTIDEADMAERHRLVP